MLRLLLLSLLQSACLASGQVFLKLATQKQGDFVFTIKYFGSWLTNGWFALTGISMGTAGVLWIYILKHYQLSVAYPLTAFAYVFGMLAAVFYLHESISAYKCTGLILITVGTFFLLKS